MLPEVQIQRSKAGAVTVAIRTDGTETQYWVPFKDQQVLGAYALSTNEVIAYGFNGRLAVFDLTAKKTVRSCETKHLHGKTAISADRSLLHILAQDHVTCWDTLALSRIRLFDGAEIKGDVRRVLHSKDPDFFPRLWRGELELFQSVRRIMVLRDDRLCVVKDYPEAAATLFIVDPKTWQVERRPVTGPVNEAIKALDTQQNALPEALADAGGERHLRTLFAGQISLPDFTESAIARALDQTAAQFERGVEEYIVMDELHLAYTCGDREVDEAELFGLIAARQYKGTIPALRRLICAYLGGLRQSGRSQPWWDGDNGMAALCHPLRTLMLLDGAGSYDVMRAYMRQRDREHESFSFNSIYTELIQRWGWTGDKDVRFGAFMALDEYCTGNWPGGGVWAVNGLVGAAPSIVSGTRLADIVLEEIRESAIEPEWAQGAIHGLVDALPAGSEFAAATIARLRELAAETEAIPRDL